MCRSQHYVRFLVCLLSKANTIDLKVNIINQLADFAINEENRLILLKNQIVKELKKFIKQPKEEEDEMLLFTSLKALVNLTNNFEKGKDYLYTENLIEKLIPLMLNVNVQISNLILILFKNYINPSIERRSNLVKLDIIPIIQKLLFETLKREKPDTQLLSSIIALIWCIVDNTNREVFATSEIPKAISDILHNYQQDFILSKASGAIMSLSTSSPEVKKIMGKTGVVQKLSTLIANKRDPKFLKNLLGALASLVGDQDNLLILHNQRLELILDTLSQNENKQIATISFFIKEKLKKPNFLINN